MKYMATQPDNAFDLAIVDPPYGMIGNVYVNVTMNKGNKKYWLSLDKKNGYNFGARPGQKYFNELFRISKNQIIWGMQYFTGILPPTQCVIVWDKKYDNSKQSACELAYTSFNTRVSIFRYHISQDKETLFRVHPTQKPVSLYKWILKNYAEPSQKILDTHLGSGSSAIAAHYFGCDFVGCEIDKEYYDAMKKRFKRETSQIAMFEGI